MDILQALTKIIEVEDAGYAGEALKLADMLLKAFPDDYVIILVEKAKIEFRNGYEREALLDFIKAYELSEEQEIFELVLEAYYKPNEKAFIEEMNKNKSLLQEYPHYRNSCVDDKMEFVPIWQDEEILVFGNISNHRFGISTRMVKESMPKKGDIFMAINALWMDDILQYERCSGISDPTMGEELPMYLVYDKAYWSLFIQVYDLDKLLKKGRIVFLVGTQSFYNYLQEDGVCFPSMLFVAETGSNYNSVLDQAYDELNREYQTNLAAVRNYYELNEKEIIQKATTKRPRILFWCCRFTAVIKYHTQDCMKAAERIGCETELLIEEDGIHRISAGYFLKRLNQFKPDIIFMINHFRFEFPNVPPNVIVITWIQDPMPYAMDKTTPAKLGKKDFIMSHFTTWKEFKKIPYSDECLIEAPIPADAHKYKPQKLSKLESEMHSCDICFVCHASDVDEYIENTIQNFPLEWQEVMSALYRGYRRYVYETGTCFYTEEEFCQFIKVTLEISYNLTLFQEALSKLASSMYFEFNQRVYRQCLVDWILDAGFTNIKLWGNGWQKEEKYKRYAMGPAENGETLSKIYQSSKIVIGNNIMTTAAARAWETMLSGGFYMSNYIPENADVTDIRQILKVDRDVEMFYNREDLIRKLHYYLEHEDERQEMMKRGRKAALEKMTYDALMKKVLNKVTGQLEENNNE